MLKEEKGITLVALVLIIVVLLIIAGVAISVAVQNSDMVSLNKKVSLNNVNSNNIETAYEDARDKVKLVFELCEANYQIDLAKGDATDRSQVFTAETLAQMLEQYNISGNTQSSLGEIDLIEGVTVKYGNEYTFLVRISTGGLVTVIKK